MNASPIEYYNMSTHAAALSEILDAMSAGAWAQASQACAELLNRHPGHPEALQLQQVLELIRQGLQDMEHGDAPSAAEQFRNVIDAMPGLYRAHNLLGNALLELGDYAAAESAYREAVRRQPGYAAGHRNLGAVLLARGEALSALASLEQALTIIPDFTPALDTLADALTALGRREEAVPVLEALLRADPEDAHAAIRLGDLHARAERFSSAAESYERVLAVFPRDTDTLEKLAHARLQLKAFVPALSALDRALEVEPERASLHANRGCVLEHLNRREDALDDYRQAARLLPDDVNTLNNLTGCLIHLKRHEEALAICRSALALAPESLAALKNMADIQQELGNTDEAIAVFQRAIALHPDDVYLLNNLGALFDAAGRPDEAVAKYREAHVRRPGDFAIWSNVLFAQSMLAANSPETYLAEALEFGRRLTSAVPVPQAGRFGHGGKTPQRLRVGLVSGDLKKHPVGYFLESTVEALASGALDLVAFNTDPGSQDELGIRLRNKMQGWHDIASLAPEEASNLIQHEEIHILMDLSGHTAHNALAVFAMRSAPVQVSWLGYWASTGVPALDYFLSDPVSSPPGDEVQFSEKLWRLPHTRLCFSAPANGALMPVKPPPFLENGYLTFGCFQRLNKMNDDTLASWAAILKAIPDARLLLKGYGLTTASPGQRLRRRLAAFGVAPDRLILEESAPREDYLQSYHRVDVMLDTYPFPGGTTTCEALWMGVPTLTLAGRSLITRQGASLLSAAGLVDWIAGTPRELITKAMAISARPDRLTSLRLGLRDQVTASPLMNATRFASDFEAALRGMWRESASLRPDATDTA